MSKMRQWGDHCRRSHEHFGVKVAELGSLLQSLKQDVEGLLAQVIRGRRREGATWRDAG